MSGGRGPRGGDCGDCGVASRDTRQRRPPPCGVMTAGACAACGFWCLVCQIMVESARVGACAAAAGGALTLAAGGSSARRF
eukprot:scaffold27597_cov247-Isochrysis_galbana.AAC.1